MALLLVATPLMAQSRIADAHAEPYRILRQAYAERDADMAASAYVEQARLVYRYEGAPDSLHQGRDAIRRSFARFFESLDAGVALDLNFRAGRSGVMHSTGNPVHYGVYRLRYGAGETSYGAFRTEITETPEGYRFARDLGSGATTDDFETSDLPLMFGAEPGDAPN